MKLLPFAYNINFFSETYQLKAIFKNGHKKPGSIDVDTGKWQGVIGMVGVLVISFLSFEKLPYILAQWLGCMLYLWLRYGSAVHFHWQFKAVLEAYNLIIQKITGYFRILHAMPFPYLQYHTFFNPIKAGGSESMYSLGGASHPPPLRKRH